jgi:hypothetical protein
VGELSCKLARARNVRQEETPVFFGLKRLAEQLECRLLITLHGHRIRFLEYGFHGVGLKYQRPFSIIETVAWSREDLVIAQTQPQPVGDAVGIIGDGYLATGGDLTHR